MDWWLVHQFVQPLLTEVGCWPMAGTLTWQNLAEDHPAKIAAIYDAAQHHALRVDAAQAALVGAGQDISAAVDWSGFASSSRQRNGIYIPREVA
ncbi:hypothetical protein A5773_13875 [Mycobacterium sp. 852014-52450_SCH5900713]|nr:hypothetical protein A5773_13875 [Mycobacterium sp. 852014-52450_SCH5900713]